MSAPTFGRVESLALYALSSSSDSGIPGYWAGYAPAPGSSLPAEATLAEVWADPGGTYLFLDATPVDLAAFRTQLDWILEGVADDVRFLWIRDVAAPPGNWQLGVLQAVPAAGHWRVTRPEWLGIGDYALTIAAGTELTEADPDTQGYGIAAGAGIAFAAPAIELPAGSAVLALDGTLVGAWTAALMLGPEAGDGMQRLGVEIRYAAAGGAGAPNEQVDVVRMGVMSQGDSLLMLVLGFDPLFPLDARRTVIGMSGPLGGPWLDATFRTAYGGGSRLRALDPRSGLPPGALAICRTPLELGDDPPYAYHLAPHGAFELDLTHARGEPARLMLGLSGLEYVAVPSGARAIAFFEAGRPAFASAPADATRDPDAPLLTGDATTAYVGLLPSTARDDGLDYYAQPPASPLFELDATNPLGPGFLPYLEIAATRLPSWTRGISEPPVAFPLAPYAGALSVDAAVARRIETAALAPERRSLIGVEAPDASAAAGVRKGVSPRGMMVEVEDGELEAIVLASMAAAPGGALRLTGVGPALRGAVLTDQLFFVVADPDAYMGAVGGTDAPASVPYCLDAEGLELAKARGVPPAVIAQLEADVGVVYPTEADFLTAVEAAGGSAQRDVLIAIAGGLRTSMSGWRLQLSPRTWRPATVDPVTHEVKGDPTMMLFKFADRSLEELVEDPAAWGWPVAGRLPKQTGPEATQGALRAFFARARAADGPAGGAYARFYRDVVADPDWNGVLFVNAPVGVDTLPTELQFLAAGIDPAQLYAHHVGFAATAIDATDSTITLGETGAFGLVAYDDPDDQVMERTVPFAFKTLGVAARFENSELAGFDARVELMVNRLFASELTKLDPTHGNNLVLSGGYQTQGGVPSYAFVLEGVNRYATTASMLDTIDVSAVRLLTESGTGTAATVTTTFVLSGDLRFSEPTSFDPFAYGTTSLDDGTEVDGWLRFGGLVVTMAFPLAKPGDQTFTASLDGVTFDTVNSSARARSLPARFPATPSGLVAVPAPVDAAAQGQSPADLGYAPVAAPLDQVPMRAPWFGLVYTIDLGTLGGLAGSAGLTMSLLAAWMPGEDPYNLPAFVGLALPGGRARGVSWPLQGVLELGARSIQFESFDDDGRHYLLRLRKFGLSAVGLSVPPGNVDLLLLPDAEGRALAWYAAYSGAGKPKAQPARSGRRELARGEV